MITEIIVSTSCKKFTIFPFTLFEKRRLAHGIRRTEAADSRLYLKNDLEHKKTEEKITLVGLFGWMIWDHLIWFNFRLFVWMIWVHLNYTKKCDNKNTILEESFTTHEPIFLYIIIKLLNKFRFLSTHTETENFATSNQSPH